MESARLRFDIPETPDWRRSVSSQMMEDIVRYMTAADRTSGDGNFVEDEWYNYAQKHSDQNTKNLDSRCSSVVSAMKVLNDYRVDMRENDSIQRFLTVDMICEMHKSLMKVDRPDEAGKIRCLEAITKRPDDSTYVFPNPFSLEQLLHEVVDLHNEHMQFYYNNMIVKTPKEKLIYIIKCAAWLFCRAISVHPFGDGNGRLCRLLANDVLMELTPFPVLLYNVGNVTQDHYFNAIIQCQNNNMPPYNISAILIDGLWCGWNDYNQT